MNTRFSGWLGSVDSKKSNRNEIQFGKYKNMYNLEKKNYNDHDRLVERNAK